MLGQIHSVEYLWKIKSILSVVFYAIYGIVCFTHCSLDYCANIILHLIIIIKSETRIFINCLRLGRETMVCDVCFDYVLIMSNSLFIQHHAIITACLTRRCNSVVLVTSCYGKTWCSCVHFSWISTCGRISRETVWHLRHPPLPTLYKTYLPVYVIVTNKRLQTLTTTWYNSPSLSYS